MKTKQIVAALSLILVCSLGGTALAGPVKIALDTPPDLEKSGTYVWAKTFSDTLTAKGVKTKIYPRLSLGNEEEVLDLLSQGLLEVSCSDMSRAGQLSPDIFGFNLPYLFDSMAHLDRVVAKTDFMEKINQEAGDKGVHILALVPAGGFMGLANTKRTVKVPADMKGLRIRAKNKSQAEYLNAWGANTVIIPWSEIYSSLQTGVADGYLNSPVVPLMFKHTEVLKHFSNIRYRLILRVALCSQDWYDGLSKDDKTSVDTAVIEANRANRTWQETLSQRESADLKASGVAVYDNTPEEIAQFKALAQPLYDKVVSPETARAFVEAAKAYK